MRKNRGIVFFTTAVFVGMLLMNQVFAQAANNGGEKTQPQPYRVGVVDMLSLMRAHPKLNADLKEFNAERMRRATDLLTKERALQEESKVLIQTVKQNTPEFQVKNDELMKRMTELDLEKNKAQRELVLMDIRMKYEAFKSIREEINSLVFNRGFAVIMDMRMVDPTEGDELSNAEIEVTQPIIWHNNQINLTTFVINALNTRFSNLPKAAQVEPNGKITFLNNANPVANGAGLAPGSGATVAGQQIPQRPTPGPQMQQPRPQGNPAAAVRPAPGVR